MRDKELVNRPKLDDVARLQQIILGCLAKKKNKKNIELSTISLPSLMTMKT